MQNQLSIAELHTLIEAAHGKKKCDLVLRGGYVVNVFTGEIDQADIGIFGARIAKVSSELGSIEAENEIDAHNMFLTPGLIDGHMHLESSMLSPAEFAKSALPLGTTAIVIDPHEIANVVGSEGIREMMLATTSLPVRVYFMIPPAVPASNLDTSGAKIDAGDMAEFENFSQVLGIAEEMDFPGVLECREEVLRKITSMPGKVIDGHAPNLGGDDLQAYAAAGISSDHETTHQWEALEKLRAGLYLMIREGSAAHNLDDLINLVNPQNIDRCILVTDDLSAADLQDFGHINHLLAKAVAHGLSPVQAIKMATLNVAQRFKLDRIGAIAPGYVADIAAFEDLESFHPAFVIANGKLAAQDSEVLLPIHAHLFTRDLADTLYLPDLHIENFQIKAAEGIARVIEAIEGEITTKQHFMEPTTLSGNVVADTEKDILKIAVIERHGKNGNISVGLIKGFALKAGALAGSVSHDSHNVVVVGTNDNDMLEAAKHVGEMRGGLVVIKDGEILADLPLPIGGLMSNESAHTVARSLKELDQAAHELGCKMEHPFMTLSFMCLPVIPELKITDRGLVDVSKFEIVPLFTQEKGKTKRAAVG